MLLLSWFVSIIQAFFSSLCISRWYQVEKFSIFSFYHQQWEYLNPWFAPKLLLTTFFTKLVSIKIYECGLGRGRVELNLTFKPGLFLLQLSFYHHQHHHHHHHLPLFSLLLLFCFLSISICIDWIIFDALSWQPLEKMFFFSKLLFIFLSHYHHHHYHHSQDDCFNHQVLFFLRIKIIWDYFFFLFLFDIIINFIFKHKSNLAQLMSLIVGQAFVYRVILCKVCRFFYQNRFLSKVITNLGKECFAQTADLVLALLFCLLNKAGFTNWPVNLKTDF